MTIHANLAQLREYHSTVSSILDRVVSNALDDTSELSGLMNRAFELAACERQLGMPEQMEASTRLGVEAGLAVFAAAAAPDEPVTYTLAGQTSTSDGAVGLDEAHTGRWELAFYGASILRDRAAVRALCSIPESLPLSSPTLAESYVGLWFKVLRGLGATDAIDGELMVQALEATDPDQLPEDAHDAALYLQVPALEVLYRIALDDADGVNTSLAAALDKHRAYWTLNEENRRNPQGYVSWPLSALAEIARARKLSVSVKSDYLVQIASAS
ncbi:MAG TPA: immunity 49 family protein [Polyangiaceae bacterium]|nr:immunity 49 family protein [Polyangiaceae bacterium]